MPIIVSCRMDGGNQALLSVASAGHPFDVPNQRADGSLSSGMGLSIVRWVAESHHGEMRVVRKDGVNEAELVFPILS